MKTRMRKCGIFAATAAVLLITALLLTNCLEPVDNSKLPGKTKAPVITSGNDNEALNIGTVTLSINNSNARTILPVTPTIDSYTVVITGVSPTTNPTGYENEPDLSTAETYSLPVGTYEFIINGLDTNGAVIAAGAKEIEIAVGDQSESIDLKAISNDGTGKLKWNFIIAGTDYSASSSETATLTFTALNGNASVPGTNPMTIAEEEADNLIGRCCADCDGITTTANGCTCTCCPSNDCSACSYTGMTLASGFYKVVLTLTKDANHFPITRTEYVHIYQNLISTWEWTETIAFTTNKHTVSFYYNDGNIGGDIYGTPNTVTYGGLATKPTTNPTNREDGSKQFVNWYTTALSSDSGSAEWNFSTMRIIRNTIIYARWADLPTLQLSVNLLPIADQAPIPGGTINFNRSNLGTSNSKVVVTINNFASFDPGSVIWEFGSYNDNVNSNTFEIDFDDATYGYGFGLNSLTPTQPHYITISGTITNDKGTPLDLSDDEEEPYSIIIEVNVTESP